MSHKATNWAIQVRGLKPATKLVLWFLADHHNPSYGCFPAQKTLADEAEMARSTVRSHLGILEHKGLILRENSVDPETHRQNPTHYRLAFEEGFDEAWRAVHSRDQNRVRAAQSARGQADEDAQ